MDMSEITLLNPQRIARCKTSYTTRRVPREVFATLLGGRRAPRPGDLVLSTLERLGQHRHIERPDGRRARLFVGDEVVLAYGHRYAPDQFEAEVPPNLDPCHMVAAGGIAAQMLSKHAAIKGATRITPLGLVGNRLGRVLNIADFALDTPAPAARRPFTVAVVGTAMNAGKTETAAQLIRGLTRAGLRVGAAKVTGTGAGGDVWAMTDAGAVRVLDFTDAGLPSTYLAEAAAIQRGMRTLLGTLAADGAEAIVFEVADGLFQRETAALLESQTFVRQVDAIVFAAGDAMGAVAGVLWLKSRQLPVRATAGVLTSSPLACREAQQATDVPVLDLDALAAPGIAEWLGARAPVVAARAIGAS